MNEWIPFSFTFRALWMLAHCPTVMAYRDTWTGLHLCFSYYSKLNVCCVVQFVELTHTRRLLAIAVPLSLLTLWNACTKYMVYHPGSDLLSSYKIVWCLFVSVNTFRVKSFFCPIMRDCACPSRALHKVACVGKRALGYAIAKRMAALNSLDLKDSDGMVKYKDIWDLHFKSLWINLLFH